MIDGENINQTAHNMSMDDIGTRMLHLTQLYELWQTGLDVIERFDKHSPFYGEKKKELENALKLLQFHMAKDYQERPYRKEIDLLPWNAENIKDEPK
jgi:hypothetical protein